MALDFSVANPRLTFLVTLAADTVLSLKSAIETFLDDDTIVSELFCDAITADNAAMVLLTPGHIGYTVYNTAAAKFYSWNGEDATVLANWIELAGRDNVRAKASFLKALSGTMKLDSSVGNAGAGNLYLMNKFINSDSVPLKGRLTTYGIPIAVNTERSCSGFWDDYYVYSLAGTKILLDVVMEVGQ